MVLVRLSWTLIDWLIVVVTFNLVFESNNDGLDYWCIYRAGVLTPRNLLQQEIVRILVFLPIFTHITVLFSYKMAISITKILKFSNTWQPCTCFTWHQLWLAEQEDDLPVVIMEYFNAPQKGLSTSITVVFGELLNILLPGHAGCNYITDHRQITSYNHKTIGHVVALAAITGTTIKYPIWKSSHSNSFDDWAPVDEIYVYPFFKGVAETWLHDGVPGW